MFISHANGYETRYGHLSALAVVTNAIVYRGQIIGTSGNTGNVFGAPTSGHHLHFEVRLNGQVTDPFGGAGANWLWLDGSWDTQGRWVGQPTPRYGATYVVDDDYPEGGTPNDPNFEKGHTIQGPYGSQWESCPPGQCPYWWRALIGNDGDMLYTNGNDHVSDYWARWLPPQDGLFEVQVYIPGSNATSWQARYYWLASWNGMPSGYAIVDQYGISNRWISLGVRSFGRCFYATAPWCGAWLSDATDENPDRDAHCGTQWCTIGVDAIRFRVPWPTYTPLVLKDD